MIGPRLVSNVAQAVNIVTNSATTTNSDSPTACFVHHATFEVKKSLALIGDYHMFLIDRALTQHRSQVLSI